MNWTRKTLSFLLRLERVGAPINDVRREGGESRNAANLRTNCNDFVDKEGGGKKSQISANVIYGSPLSEKWPHFGIRGGLH